jgi:hypothetical protein
MSHTGVTVDPDEEPEELAITKKLTRSVDVVILDWYLASSEGPEHCLTIIESLLDEKESRFIIVLTQHADVKSAFASHFGDRFPITGDFAHAASGKHAAFLNKPPAGGADAANEILSLIERLIAAAYPDYIHWAALEMAANIKKFVPRWLEALPRGTDWALLSEYCHDGDQAAAIVVGNLLEDLGHAIDIYQLESAKAGNCKGADWPGRCEVDVGIQGATRQLMALESPAPKLKQEIVADLAKSSSPQTSDFVKSQKTLASFCENVSQGAKIHTSIRPGSIMVAEEQQGVREIFVCVSQACDCLHRDQLLIVRGTKAKTTKQGATTVSFQETCYRFDPETKNLRHLSIKTKEGRRLPEGFVIVGQLRSATARRLTSRFWNHMTRSAVNLPAYTRAERIGE